MDVLSARRRAYVPKGNFPVWLFPSNCTGAGCTKFPNAVNSAIPPAGKKRASAASAAASSSPFFLPFFFVFSQMLLVLF